MLAVCRENDNTKRISALSPSKPSQNVTEAAALTFVVLTLVTARLSYALAGEQHGQCVQQRIRQSTRRSSWTAGRCRVHHTKDSGTMSASYATNVPRRSVHGEDEAS
jgi:hypothetical protein